MSEFGAKPCSHSGCRQHDFLPVICAACGFAFCAVHYEIEAHACPTGEEYLATRRDGERIRLQPGQQNSHPLSSNKPSEVMAAVSARFHGREDELNADVVHYNIKASEDTGSGGAGSSARLLKSAEMAVNSATTAKGKRVSTQVHRMLVKSKSVGDTKLRMEDRFFLEVHYSGNNDDVHHLFFSRLWTVGRTVDGIVKTRRRYLRLGPGEEDGPLELALADSSHGLPMGRVLQDLAPELESFDVVTVRPRRPTTAIDTDGEKETAAGGQAATTTTTTATIEKAAGAAAVAGGEDATDVGMSSGLSSRSSVVAASPTREGNNASLDGQARHKAVDVPCLSTSGDNGECSRGEAVVVSGGDKDAVGRNFPAGGRSCDGGGGVAAMEEERKENINLDESGDAISITIGHGKAVYQLGGIRPQNCSVLDLKKRLEPITGVPFSRQKLIFKGVLRDTDFVHSTKLVEGAKVMLLGAPSASC